MQDRVDELSLMHVCMVDHAYKKVSGGGMNPIGGSPVCGSVPMGLLNKRICGYGLWSS